jgi:uncharacterized RmlC-like cupin family protein
MSTDLNLRVQTPGFPPYALGAQNQQLAPLVHSGVVNPRGLTCGMVKMNGGHHAVAHIHEHTPILVFVHTGMIASLVGGGLKPYLHAPGSVLWIAPGIVHLGVNLDPVATASLLEARTDNAFNEDVVGRPDLDELAAERAADLQRRYARGDFDDQLTAPSVHIVDQ